MGKVILVGLLAFAVALSGQAYAEVQNVKVGGDIDLKAIAHYNFDLQNKQGNDAKGPPAGAATPSVTNDDDTAFFLSTVHLTVDADLTDNVSSHVRLLNQRIWEAHTTGDDSIVIDSAYVVLKEFLYSPLTVIAGRQDLKYGTGFIVGAGLLADPEGIFTNAGASREFSAFNAYDAIRLIFDFAPITVEGLIAKINETGVSSDDTDLYGALVNYKLDRWSAEIEPYWFYKSDEGASLTTSDVGALRTYENVYTHTTGVRAVASPIENLWLNLEGAYQFGDIVDDGAATVASGAIRAYQERDRRAWAANIDVRYDWVNVPWTPNTGLGWVFYSGEEPAGGPSTANRSDQTDKYNAWDSMFRGSFTTWIQDFFAGNDGGGLYTTFDGNDTSAATNRHLIYADFNLKPMEDVTLWGRYTHARFDESPRPSRKKHAGDEIDVKALYDYTEDVQLSVGGAWFFPGDFYDYPETNVRGKDLAWELLGGASVKF